MSLITNIIATFRVSEQRCSVHCDRCGTEFASTLTTRGPASVERRIEHARHNAEVIGGWTITADLDACQSCAGSQMPRFSGIASPSSERAVEMLGLFERYHQESDRSSGDPECDALEFGYRIGLADGLAAARSTERHA